MKASWALSASSQKWKCRGVSRSKNPEGYLPTDEQWKLIADVPVKKLDLMAGYTTPLKKDS